MIVKKPFILFFLISLTLQKGFISFLQDDYAIPLNPTYDKSKAVQDSGSKTFDD